MQYKNNKKEKSIFAKTIEESKNEVSIDWAIRNSKSVVNDVIAAKPELKSNINELKAIKRYNRGFIDKNTLVNDYIDYSVNLLGLFYKTYKAIKIVGNTQYHAASQYYCQVGEIQWLSYKNGPNMCTGGTAIAESTYSNDVIVIKAFDNNESSIWPNCWSSNTKTTGTESWICYIRQTAIPIYCIRIYPREGYAYLNFKNFKILASNNTTNGIDGTWDTLLTNQNTYYVNNWSEHYITNQTLNNNIIAKGGNTVTKITDNGINYAVHTFTSSGNFELISNNVEVEYLIVAGGGGGGETIGGGGGGGGVKINNMFINKNIYPIIIGSGGTGGQDNKSGTYPGGSSGTNSSFNNVISLGGGAGGGYNLTGTGTGGGNGGGQGAANGNGVGAGNGNYNGGTSSNNQNSGAGGGGSAQVGGNSISGTPGKGGNGLQSKINGTLTYYAGGGGGGARNPSGGTGGLGGLGGGGAGGTGSANGITGTINTGGGGGGGGYQNSPVVEASGGNGGSGIVIIRYRIP